MLDCFQWASSKTTRRINGVPATGRTHSLTHTRVRFYPPLSPLFSSMSEPLLYHPVFVSLLPFPRLFLFFYFRKSLLNTLSCGGREKEAQREFPRSQPASQPGAGYSVTVIWCLRAHHSVHEWPST